MDLDLQQDNQKIRIFYFQEIHVQYNFSFYWVIRTPTKKRGSSMRKTSSTLPCPEALWAGEHLGNALLLYYLQTPLFLDQISILFHPPLGFPAAPPCRLSGSYSCWQRT
eukprot:snap_masked-scaffold_10-processed-gene-4.39-mRNA-1 protein AED:1.00 eAED:1.00 QI:0/0/0/0/1/1/6/0/108